MTTTAPTYSEDELRRRRGGRPRLPEHLKRNTPRVTFRMAAEDIDTKIEKPRHAAGIDRTAQIHRMLNYAAENMPANYGLDI